MQWKLFPLKPPGLVLHGATNHRECKLLHIYTLPQQHMRDNCTRLQIAPVLSCSRAKSAPGCSIHLNPSEQLQKLPPAVTPITMSTCTTFICSFFFWKKGGLSEHQCFFDTQYFCLLSAANPLIQQSTIMLTLCTTISQFLCFSPFFISMLLLFSKFGETVRKCLLSSPECEGPKL